MDRPFPTIEVLGVPVAKLLPKDALIQIERIASEEGAHLIAYANAHTLNLATSDPSYRELLRNAAIVLNDGAGIAIAARVNGDRFPANLNGSDFNPLILGLAGKNGWPVFLLGARPGVAERAGAAMKARYPALQIAGTRDGYWPAGSDDQVAAEIRSSGATLVMAALGNPMQERWLAEHLAATGARLGVGVGAFFDFAAGEVPRAPAWMNRMGIEWVFRLLQEPRRLWRRYVVGNPVFLAHVLRDRFSRR
ncbi:MAG: WecB/TagA/CpsF family glycosyltransferase [Actinomycetota bacterium]